MKRVIVDILDGTEVFAKNIPDEDVEEFVRKIKTEGIEREYEAFKEASHPRLKWPHGAKVSYMPHAIRSIEVVNMTPV